MLREKAGTGTRVLSQASDFFRSDFCKLGRFVAIGLSSLAVLVAFGCGGGEKEKIAFVSDQDGDPEIYIMDVDGLNQIPVTSNGAVDEQPRFSPDRKWIAYVSEESGDREIHMLQVNKEERTYERLTHSEGADDMQRWSPDGSRIAFISSRGGEREIYLINSDGTGLTQVTSSSSNPQLSGWSPNGQWLAFIVQEDGEEPGIITLTPDGVNLIRLTTTEDFEAQWSPDGKRIAFTSAPEAVSTGDGGVSTGDRDLEIFVMNADGFNRTRLTNNDATDHQVSWSPDGKKLVFVSDRDGDAEIYVMKADGSKLEQLTSNQVKEEQPVWSPDGKKIAFVSYLLGTGEIFVMNADGADQKRLTSNDANDTQPAW